MSAHIPLLNAINTLRKIILKSEISLIRGLPEIPLYIEQLIHQQDIITYYYLIQNEAPLIVFRREAPL